MKKHLITLTLLFFTTFLFSQSNSVFKQTKPNDIMVAVINSPNLTAYDFASQCGLYKYNTSLYSFAEYKTSKFVKRTFTVNGIFDNKKYANIYNRARLIYSQLPSDESDFDNKFPVKYSPFDATRPKGAKTFDPTAR